MKPITGGIVVLGLLLMGGCASSSRDRLSSAVGGNQSEPASREYSSTFDSRAAKIEITPGNKSRRVETDQIFIATVYDREGNPRSRRRVEWTIEGPGTIVATDVGGLFPYRGRLIDPKYAIVYTNTFSHTITQENDDPRDDFEVRPGQTWCVVRSNEPGEMTVTAYTPDVVDEQKGRARSVVTWTGTSTKATEQVTSDTTPRDRSQDPLPIPASPVSNRPATNGPTGATQISLDVKLPRAVGLGQETPVSIALANLSRTQSPPLTVLATLPADAEFVRSEPAAISRTGNTLNWAIESIAGNQTQEITLILRPTAQVAMNLEVTAETADGLKATQRVGSTVGQAGLSIQLDGPKYADLGSQPELSIIVANPGTVAIENAIAWVDVPNSPTTAQESKIGSVAPGQSKTVKVPLQFKQAGRYPVRVNVTANGGLSKQAETSLTVGQAELTLSISAPDTIPIGEDGLFEYRVTNNGDTGLQDVILRTNLPSGLDAKSATDNGKTASDGARWSVGRLAPRESKVLRLNTTSQREVERLIVTASAEGLSSGGARVQAERASVKVSVLGQPLLQLKLAEPVGPVKVGGRAVYRVTVQNRGRTSARQVELTASMTEELKPIRGSGPNQTQAELQGLTMSFPHIPELPAGSTATFYLETQPTRSGSGRMSVAVKSQQISTPLKEEQATAILGK